MMHKSVRSLVIHRLQGKPTAVESQRTFRSWHGTQAVGFFPSGAAIVIDTEGTPFPRSVTHGAVDCSSQAGRFSGLPSVISPKGWRWRSLLWLSPRPTGLCHWLCFQPSPWGSRDKTLRYRVQKAWEGSVESLATV